MRSLWSYWSSPTRAAVHLAPAPPRKEEAPPVRMARLVGQALSGARQSARLAHPDALQKRRPLQPPSQPAPAPSIAKSSPNRRLRQATQPYQMADRASQGMKQLFWMLCLRSVIERRIEVTSKRCGRTYLNNNNNNNTKYSSLTVGLCLRSQRIQPSGFAASRSGRRCICGMGKKRRFNLRAAPHSDAYDV